MSRSPRRADVTAALRALAPLERAAPAAELTVFERAERPYGRPAVTPAERYVETLADELGKLRQLGQVALAEYERSYRSSATFVRAFGVALDLEPHPRRAPTGDELAQALNALEEVGAAVGHGTPRGARGFVVFTRPVGAEELGAIARGLNRKIAPKLPPGWAADGSNARPAQAWRGPRGHLVEVFATRGLDPAQLPHELPPAPPRPAAPMPAGGLEVSPRWVEARLAAVLADLEAAPEGQRADAAFRAGLKLGSVGHLLDDEAGVKARLLDAATATGLGRDEARGHLRRGWACGRRKPKDVRLRGAR